jgi:hypothetical protein
VHNSDSLCELWKKRMGHLHHRVLPIPREIVTSLLEFRIEQHSVCKGCTFGKHAKASFPSEHRSMEILDLVTKDEEQEASKVEPRSPMISRGYQPSGEERETIAPSTSIRRPQWFTQTLRDA